MTSEEIIAKENNHKYQLGTNIQNINYDSLNWLKGIIKFLLIMGVLFTSIALYLVPLLWCIPTIIVVWKKLNRNQSVSIIGSILIFCFVAGPAAMFLIYYKYKLNKLKGTA